MNRQQVKSSSLLSVGYDANLNIMELEFRGGSVYRYFNVPEQVHEELLKADSKGSYFHERIRGHYRYERVG